MSASKVTFETSEGDILAMQSTLCQLIFVSLQHQPALLYGGEIRCEDKNDYEILERLSNLTVPFQKTQ